MSGNDTQANTSANNNATTTSASSSTSTTTGFKKAGKGHPLYQTTNSQYGAKEVQQLHKPTQWNGRKGAFTKEFVGGMYRDNSLNCTRTRSNVMKDPSFGTNAWHPN